MKVGAIESYDMKKRLTALIKIDFKFKTFCFNEQVPMSLSNSSRFDGHTLKFPTNSQVAGFVSNLTLFAAIKHGLANSTTRQLTNFAADAYLNLMRICMNHMTC